MGYKFSVIIPVYNAEKTINRCLDSLLSQKQDNAEIILINDGSKDRSGEICKEYASEHDCIVYLEQKNAGASSARNAGLNVASGEFITFVDSDDYVLDGYFKGLDSFNEDFVVYSYHTVRPKEVSEFCFGKNLLNVADNTDIILGVLRDRIAGPVNKRFKRSIIEKHQIRFKQNLIIGEDFIFGLEYMLLCESSRVEPATLYCVDETGKDSITRAARYDLTQSLKIYDYAFEIALKCGWNALDKKKLQQQLDFLFCRTAFACSERCIKSGSKIGLKDCVTMFRSKYREDIQPINIVHCCMKICLKYEIVSIYGIIAFIHRIVKKVKRCNNSK